MSASLVDFLSDWIRFIRMCYDCLCSRQDGRRKANFEEAWNQVRPSVNTYPSYMRQTETGQREPTDLLSLTPAEKALIDAIHPVGTIQKNFLANRKYKEESISLLHSPDKTWAEFLPRENLNNRFMIVERTFKNSTKKYMIANSERVHQWLLYLFANHTEYIRLKASGELRMSNVAIDALKRESELAEVLFDRDDNEHCEIKQEDGILQAAIESGLSKCEIYTFDKFPALHLKSQQIQKIKQKGLIKIIEDDSERNVTHSASANLCFPHLYSKGENSPLDFGEYSLAAKLLK